MKDMEDMEDMEWWYDDEINSTRRYERYGRYENKMGRRKCVAFWLAQFELTPAGVYRC